MGDVLAEFLGNAPAGQLLCLTLMPIGASVLLVAGLFILRQRDQQGGGLGMPAKRSRPYTNESSSIDHFLDDEDDEIDISVLSSFHPSALPVDKPKPEPPPPPKQPSPVVPPVHYTQPKAEPAPDTTIDKKPSTLLALKVDLETEELMVQLGNSQFTKLTDIPNKQTGQYLLALTGHLLKFTNGMYGTVNGVKSIGIPNVGPLPSLPESLSTLSNSTETNLSIQFKQRPLDIPSTSPIKETLTTPTFNNPKPVDDSKSLLAGFSLAEQINDIVQKQLPTSSLAETTEIEITSAPGGGIKITVNDQVYYSVEDINDSAVYQFIKACIKEWEKQ